MPLVLEEYCSSLLLLAAGTCTCATWPPFWKIVSDLPILSSFCIVSIISVFNVWASESRTCNKKINKFCLSRSLRGFQPTNISVKQNSYLQSLGIIHICTCDKWYELKSNEEIWEYGQFFFFQYLSFKVSSFEPRSPIWQSKQLSSSAIWMAIRIYVKLSNMF